MPNEKRTASNSSNMSDQHEKREAKRIHINPLIANVEELPSDIQSLAVFMVTKLNQINENINDALENMSAKIDESTNKSTELQRKYEELSKAHEQLMEQNQKLISDQEQLREQQLRLEIFQRRNNGVFSGIPESNYEKGDDCKRKLLDILKDVPGASMFTIGRCHRIGQKTPGYSRDVIAHFPNENDKSVIIENLKLLPRNVSIHEDLPNEIASRKRELLPIFKLAKKQQDANSTEKIKLKQDKLYIGKKVYTVRPKNNLHTLPSNLQPMLSAKMENDSAYTFFGKYHPFSNFNACQIEIDDKVYPTSEHYIQEQKALTFNQVSLAQKIYEAESPYECKKLSKDISNFQYPKWKEVAPAIVERAITAKVNQSELFKEALVSTGLKKIGEATRDTMWGTGYTLNDEKMNKLETKNWSKDNLMGVLLESVRDKIKK